jgi:shikimate dehydrogenase
MKRHEEETSQVFTKGKMNPSPDPNDPPVKSPLVSGKTGLYAILGDPIEHALSPVIHNSVFQSLGLDKVFLALRVNRSTLKLAMDMVRTLHFKGIVTTMPLKEEVMAYLDDLSPEARLIGAVNTIVNNQGKLTGYNTDSLGFWVSLEELNVTPQTFFLFGAGGVSKAIAAQIALQGAKKLYITNRRLEKALALSDKMMSLGRTEIEVIPWEPEAWEKGLLDSELIVNGTSLGMKHEGDLSELVLSWDRMSRQSIIYDTVYEPLETTLLRKARSLGFPVIPGTALVLHQALIASRFFTGKEPPSEVVREAIRRFGPGSGTQREESDERGIKI